VRIRVRLCLTKGGWTRFLSQLDFASLLVRALRRANLPIEYSHGYTPRAKISFGPALPVGVASECEYVDIYLAEQVNLEELRNGLSGQLPGQIHIKGARAIPLRSLSLSAIIDVASYRVEGESIDLDKIMSKIKDNSIPHMLGDVLIKAERKGEQLQLYLDIKRGKVANPYNFLSELLGVEKEELLLLDISRTGLYIRGEGGILLSPMDERLFQS